METPDAAEPTKALTPEARRQKILAKTAMRMALVVGGNVEEVRVFYFLY